MQSWVMMDVCKPLLHICDLAEAQASAQASGNGQAFAQATASSKAITDCLSGGQAWPSSELCSCDCNAYTPLPGVCCLFHGCTCQLYCCSISPGRLAFNCRSCALHILDSPVRTLVVVRKVLSLKSGQSEITCSGEHQGDMHTLPLGSSPGGMQLHGAV